MPQAVIIQHEPTLATSAKKVAAAKGAGDAQAFSAQLDKQVKQTESETKPAQTNAAAAAKSAEADKKLAADGNNLPTETSANNEQPDSVDKAANTTADGEAEARATNESEASEAELSSVSSDSTAVTTAAASAVGKDAESKVSEKNNQVPQSSSQQAGGDSSKLNSPTQGSENKSQHQAVAKAVSAADKVGTESVKAETAQVDVSKKLASDTQATDSKATPNLAAVLKQTSEEDAKAPKIRADILQALQRQQANQEVAVSVRNQAAAQITAKAEVSPVTQSVLSTPLLTESGLTPVTTLAAGSSLSASGLTTAQAGALSPTLSLPVQPGMQNPAWAQVMSGRVVWMAKEGLQQAQLRMNPANLGPVEVKLHVQNEQASVTFLAQHSATRDALEQALPRLRESFAENGMELTNAQVGEQQQHHQEQSEQTSDSHFFTQAASQEDDIETEAVETVSSEQTAGLSLYA